MTWARSTAAAALLALIVTTWSLATGRYGGPDEPAHVIRAAAVATGDLLGEHSAALAPGFRVVTVPAELATGDPICFRQDSAVPAGCSASRAADGTTRTGTAAGIYPPGYYALVGVPVAVVGATESSEAYRAIAIALHVLVLAIALVRALSLGRGALLLIAGVAPAAWFLFGVVNPTAMEIALLLLAWVGLARLGPDAGIRALAWIAGPAAIAIAIRPVALLPAAALAAATTALVPRWTWRRRAVLWAPLALGVISVAVWNAWVEVEFDDPRAAVDLGFASALWRSVRDIPGTLREAAGSLSWQEFSAPWPAQVLWAVVAVTLAAIAWLAGSARVRVALGLWLATLLLGPVAFETLFADRIGFIWQGRYSLSTLVGLGALAAIAIKSGAVAVHASRAARCAPALLAAAGVAEVAAFWALLRRSTVGTGGSWWLADERGWDPALDPRLLLAANVAAVATSVVALRSQPTK